MNNQSTSIQTILKQQKILPLFYHPDPSVTVLLTQALYNTGIRMVEFTNRGIAAKDCFKALVEARNLLMPELILAVGTIAKADDAIDFIAAGADVLISPFFDEGVASVAKEKAVCWIPGCMTPKEIHIAVNEGCTIVKLFPGNVLKPEFVIAVKPIFSNTDFIITGGVEPEASNVKTWLDAGALATGLGSKLITTKILEERLFEELQLQTTKLMEAL
ncbi:bifunctional 4-hydroxy-2-oxoglutarate aldolase/2-dehydro-3-deoxy-phosphogluconate aldolase [Sediminibacterium sp.]|uniref:bifunctional 4-hydroxy-2-oxoglutarate aldolase/2-dehydro-3-deoxy-phosphogluconate aldolase n=1 Tax=Sediminibacterium sp. TaxID=1917865 RepID=UPI0027359389|nr:bifunctional 4-hydroxy-2-oxoglutarate aldolase/2-dehydro-3-deoxy-phosphogluconate aldolase [Sediminibacterium sp.]MDP3394596.1 bifunctional 4-hydroxy-2-oxoglutarate aldolase/2-dehydro-3-deoxy-phosphogluconate aldolase [Sediminibacterium sp.]MDP3568431.1 bifunctional 4-hydroxy-2-oxoglutarate aldolase/2-dehydro-3-deoxy-phosphogluconate aldolase [Sediminibacterium sp.]